MSDEDEHGGWRAVTIGDVVVATGPVPGGTRFRRHEHEGPHVCCVLGGGFVESRRGGSEVAGPGTVRVSPSARHDIDFAPQGARCAVLHLPEPCAARDSERDMRFLRDPWLARLATQLGHALGDPTPIGEPRVEEATVELLAQIERRRAGRASPPPPWLRTARELLHDDPTASSLGALAARLDVHRVHLARAFRDHYGETVGAHLRRVRLLRAVRLLHERDLPLTRVALDAGYADQSHMTRALRRHIDLTPVQARRTLLSFYLSRDEPRWFRYLPESHTLYVAYQSSVPPQTDGGETIDAFFTRVLAAADEPAVERLVLDVRGNGGGESFYNRQLLLGLVRRTRLDQRGKLFVVIGRSTSCAAMNLVNEFERYTNATFVGEPTASPPAFFGDHRTFTLPNSGIGVNISSLWWQTMNPRDTRPFVAPQIYAEESADDYRAGRDPALAAIFARAEQPTLSAKLMDAPTAGDTARAWLRLSEYIANPENRYLGVEAEVNALGYEQLRLGNAARAVQPIALNVRAYPRSANAYDSLGDAYERSGRGAEALAMYRRALALDAGMSSSRDGLRRLGDPGS